jgi:hypothetical protein
MYQNIDYMYQNIDHTYHHVITHIETRVLDLTVGRAHKISCFSFRRV